MRRWIESTTFVRWREILAFRESGAAIRRIPLMHGAFPANVVEGPYTKPSGQCHPMSFPLEYGTLNSEMSLSDSIFRESAFLDGSAAGTPVKEPFLGPQNGVS